MNIEERVRDELRAEASRMRIQPGSIERVRRRGVARRRRRVALVMATAGIGAVALVVGMSQLWSQDPGGVPVADGSTSTTTVETTLPTSTSVPPSSTTTAVSDAVSNRMVVAGPEAIAIVADGAVVERIDTGPMMTALDDRLGGFVVQIGVSASSILHLTDPEAGFVEIIIPGQNETLTLHDVVEIDGSASVVYTARLSGVAPEEAREDLRVFDLTTGGDRLVAQVGGYESGASQVSYAGGMFLVTMNAEGYTWFDTYRLDGDEVPFEANPRTETESAEDFLVWVGLGALAPDGDTLAYVQGSPRSEAPFRLVVVDVTSGVTTWAADLPDTARENTVSRLDWNGETAVVSIRAEGAVVARSGSVVARLPVAGTAALIDRS